jgi:ferritin-like metal-binding protein YciE
MAKTKASATRGRQSGRRTASATTRTKAKTKANSNGSLLEEFFIDGLKDIYGAEKALTKALPRMAKAATSRELKKAFEQHLEVTRKQINRLDKIFEQMGKRAQAKKCEAMEGLIEESESIISETKNDTFTRDAALIISAQKVEHYEIAAYGGLAQLARTMNKKGIANSLGTTLNEEKKADEMLTRIAERSINVEAAGEEGDKSTLKESFMAVFS